MGTSQRGEPCAQQNSRVTQTKGNALTKQIDDLRSQCQKSSSEIQDLDRRHKETTAKSGELQSKIKEKKEEYDFAVSMKGKLGGVSGAPALPSRRGRLRPPTMQRPAPEPEQASPPPVPARRSGGLADRMKMFESS